jgi:hypothetical protein
VICTLPHGCDLTSSTISSLFIDNPRYIIETAERLVIQQ